jgi:hypothetical protein
LPPDVVGRCEVPLRTLGVRGRASRELVWKDIIEHLEEALDSDDLLDHTAPVKEHG